MEYRRLNEVVGVIENFRRVSVEEFGAYRFYEKLGVRTGRGFVGKLKRGNRLARRAYQEVLELLDESDRLVALSR